ncbi:hypothetical protein [Phytohabitans aurantiacus]|uniref:Gram-positive cocci surface proteins LPxTG domain-containing protein n=1 Tax=Phytohabitans aurantiacus TaxID=3016789 RepID=A0ABQ5QUU2_9ACTN|nr:hypothetical protein [Phytohabitans aurantiacus]GLH98351.1 hypothetical protein Pa4123_36260 [Phytohabitans aurantiacus]
MPLVKIAAAVAVVGAVAVGPAPVMAGKPCTLPYAAGAGAELVRLDALDLRPLGLPTGPVAVVRLASARSGMAANSRVNAAASARYLDAKLLGIPLPAGPLSTSVYQEAPPRNPKPAKAHAPRKDLGLVEAGAGNLIAHARGASCHPRRDDVTSSSTQVAGADILPGPGGTALVRLPASLRGRTSTGLVERDGAVQSTATAAAALADFRLFAGTPTEIAIKVIKPPTLTVSTGGTAATTGVRYASPLLEVSGPGVPPRRIDAPGETVDLVLPRTAGGAEAARADAKARRLPLVAGDPLAETLGALHPERLRGASGGAEAGPLTLPALSGLPNPGELVAGEALPPLGGDASLVRISLGDARTEIADRSVRARVASIRIQVAAGASIADIAIGDLDAGAFAPAPAREPVLPGGGGLPITGRNVGIVAAAGALLLTAGSALIVTARRRHG